MCFCPVHTYFFSFGEPVKAQQKALYGQRQTKKKNPRRTCDGVVTGSSALTVEQNSAAHLQTHGC